MARPERIIFLNRSGHAPKLRDTVDGNTEDGYVLTWDSTNKGWYPSDSEDGLSRARDPMVWASQEIIYKRDGVRVLATIPYNAGNAPAAAVYKLRSVINIGQATGTVRIRLYNAVDGEYVTNASISTTATTPTTVTSSQLTVGASAGNLKNSAKAYEIHADITGSDDNGDFGVVGFAGLSMQ